MSISNEIMEFVVNEVAGPDVVPLVKYLENKKNVSEFKIAECIDKEINATRNMLYRLYNNNLASFIRKKDKEKGWYIYYWTFNSKNIKHLAEKIILTKIERTTERLEREKQTMFYMCENGCMRLDFDQAVNFHFKCPECGELLEESDNSTIIERLNADLIEYEKELKKVRSKRATQATSADKTGIDFKATAKKAPAKKVTTKKTTTASSAKKKTSKKTTKKTTTKKATAKKTAKKTAQKATGLGFAKTKKESKDEKSETKRNRKKKYNKKQDIFNRLDGFKIKK